MPLSPGTGLGHYEILAPLGSGGMGEVYLAQDARLRRNVALKVLPAEVAADSNRMRRFQREATAAATLNHPHIAHIYEIGAADGIHFIAMEFIDGETLRDKIHRDKAPLTKLLKYLVQAAEGLTKAHAAGIVHRDLKPDNIMITRDDYAKVLDFGLAKLIEPQGAIAGSGAPLSELPTAVMPQHSQPGMVMGTTGYMSPEQAQGRVAEIDHRSDIFSFGCILFEAATGHKAFAGEDALDSLHKIVHGTAPQIKEFNPLAPDEIQRIVQRCLAKDPNKRYHSIKDVAIELEEIGQELKSAELHASSAPQTAATIQGGTSTTQSVSGGTSVAAPRSTSSAEYVVNGIKRHKLGASIALAIVLVAVGAVAFGLYRLVTRRSPFALGPLKVTRLTSTGLVSSATITSDGKYVFYVQDDGEKESLWMTQVSTSSALQIVAPSEAHYIGLTVSRDGNFLYYLRRDDLNQDGGLYRMPALGGTAQKLMTNVLSPVTLSPDGKQLAFVRCDGCLDDLAGRSGDSSLIVANADGSTERVMAVHRLPDVFSPGGPAWSPDGTLIAIGNTHRGGSGGSYRNVVAIRVSDGTEQPITSKQWGGPGLSMMRIIWLPDNSGVFVTGVEQGITSKQVWHLAWPRDEARNVSNDLGSYADLSISSDSATVAAVNSNQIINLWVTPTGDIGAAKRISSGIDRSDGARGISWTPDGKIIYCSTGSGSESIWSMNADGSENKLISPKAAQNIWPVVSPNGQFVVWAALGTGRWELWRMGIDGSDPLKLTNGGYFQDITPDGKWIIYSPPFARLMRIPIEGGEPTRLIEEKALRPVVSPDGQLIACFYALPHPDSAVLQGRGIRTVAVLSINGGRPLKTFETLPAQGVLDWSPDGKALVYIVTRAGVSNLWAQPVDGGSPKQLTNFTSEQIFNFAWSRDGKQLALSRGVVTRDVVLITGLK